MLPLEMEMGKTVARQLKLIASDLSPQKSNEKQQQKPQQQPQANSTAKLNSFIYDISIRYAAIRYDTIYIAKLSSANEINFKNPFAAFIKFACVRKMTQK